MHEARRSEPVHWTALRDGMGKKVERGFRMGDMYTPVADSC